MLVNFLVLAVSLCTASAGFEPELSDVQLLYTVVVCRHGDRTPDANEMAIFPDRIVTDDTYYPEGMGALTLSGKDRAYRMGKRLRSRYDGYLSSIYLPAEIEIRATAYPRTRMTALCALAGLYRPEDIQKWNGEQSNLDWQPIPYNTESSSTDPLLAPSSCLRYRRALSRTTTMLHTDADMAARYDDKLQYISKISGVQVNSLYEMTNMVGALQGELNYGTPLPKWAEDSWDLMKEMEGAGFQTYVYTDEMKRLSGGKIVNDFIDVSLSVASGEAPPTKMLFNSAHDSTVIGVLAAALVLEEHRPKYTAAFSLELYGNVTSGEYGVATVYAPSADEPVQYLRVKGCDGLVLCPLDRFKELTAPYAVSDYLADCAV